MTPVIDWPWVGLLGATGVAMALLSSFIGLRAWMETTLWVLAGGGWVYLTFQEEIGGTFLTLLLAGIAAGLASGILQTVWLKTYRKRNPWYHDKTTESRGEMAIAFIGFGAVAGAAFGAIVGGVAWGLHQVL